MKNFLLLLSLFIGYTTYSQIGGQNTYPFLDLDFNSRSMALGGDFALSNDDDINLSVSNPASITDKMDKHLSLNHAIFPGGVNYGQIVYGKNFDEIGTFTGHLRYVTYGSMQRFDEFGIQQGTFTAGDYALGVGYAKKLNKYFSIGGNFNFIFSHLESYVSFGIGADLSAKFYDDKSNINAVVILRNVGVQIKGYTPDNHEPMPTELLAGISYKFHHAPFRLSLMGHDLSKWDLSYNIPGAIETYDALTGDTIPVPSASFVEKLFRHMNVGIEILPTKNFSIRLGYNVNRRMALGVENRMGISGFSAGVGFKIKKFEFDYGISFYSASGISNMFTITTNLNSFYRNN